MKHRRDKMQIRQYNKAVTRLTFSFVLKIAGLSMICSIVIYLLLRCLGSLNVRPFLTIFVIWVLCFLFTYTAAYYIILHLFKPLNDMNQASKKVTNGDYTVRVECDNDISMIADAADNFNKMVQEISSSQILQNDILSNISHEIRTPITALRDCLTLLQDRSLSDNEHDEQIKKAVFIAEKLDDLTDNIQWSSEFKKQDDNDRLIPYRLDEQIQECIAMLEPKWRTKEIIFDTDLQECTYTGQRSLMLQVWTNLISNSIMRSKAGGTIMIYLEATNLHYNIYIADDGDEMDNEQPRQIWDSTYQTDDADLSQEEGLEIALCKKILDKIGANLFIKSHKDSGTLFLVQLIK